MTCGAETVTQNLPEVTRSPLRVPRCLIISSLTGFTSSKSRVTRRGVCNGAECPPPAWCVPLWSNGSLSAWCVSWWLNALPRHGVCHGGTMHSLGVLYVMVAQCTPTAWCVSWWPNAPLPDGVVCVMVAQCPRRCVCHGCPMPLTQRGVCHGDPIH